MTSNGESPVLVTARQAHILWLSDLHLNFLSLQAAERLVEGIGRERYDAAVVTGDTAEAPSLAVALSLLARGLGCPVYLVLGNHDFYHGSIAAVREDVRAIAREQNLHYLSDSGVVEVCPGLALVGHDGWADGRNGNFLGTTVELNDFHLIEDFRGLGRRQRYAVMERLAGEAASHFQRVLPLAAARSERVILATHVPPFAEAAFHEGVVSSPDYLPFFSSRCAGEAILDVMRAYPHCQLTVLCGHTHGAGICRPLINVEVRVAAAQYGRPAIAGVLEWVCR